MRFPRRALSVLFWLSLASAATAQAPSVRSTTLDLEDGSQVVFGDEDGRPFARHRPGAGKPWVELEPPTNRLMLRHGAFDPLVDVPAVPLQLRSTARSELFIVQFHTQPLEAYRRGLHDLGVEIHTFLPYESYLVRMPLSVAARVAALPFVRWVGDFHPAYRLEPVLLAEIATGGPMPRRRYNAMMVDWKRDSARLIQDLQSVGGYIVHVPSGGILAQVELTGAELIVAAGMNSVLWIDRWSPIELDVDNARIQGGADYLEPKKPIGFTGKGMRGYNTEGIFAHPEFNATAHRGNPIRHLSTATSAHGNNVNGIIFSRGDSASYRGLVPDAQCVAASSSAVSANRDLATMQAIDPSSIYRVLFMTASWGGGRTTLYNATASAMDNTLFNHQIAHTQSQSNAGNRLSRPQAWAKNIISVGGVVHGNNANPADDFWSGASIGPAEDGRIKPDVAAYYDSIGTTDGATGYTTGFGGTSGATPITAGHVGLIQEIFTDGLLGHQFANPGQEFRFENRPKMATSKALLINGARQYAFSGTGHNLTRVHQGWGFPNVQDLYDQRERTFVIDEWVVLRNGWFINYLHYVPPGTPELSVTMVYTDPAGAPNSTVNRINNLDLEVRDTNNVLYYGNNGLTAGNYSTPGGTPNDRDTVENVILQNPPAGAYTITVRATSIVQDAHVETAAVDADFALVVRGARTGRDRSGSTIDWSTTGPGNLDLTITNPPAPGTYSEGWVFYSFTPIGPPGFGPLYGLISDNITSLLYNQPAIVGSPFHFLSTSNSVFPNAPYAFGPGIYNAVRTLTIDVVGAFIDNTGQVVEVTNVSRIAVP